jgi:hypothetical protein
LGAKERDAVIGRAGHFEAIEVKRPLLRAGGRGRPEDPDRATNRRADGDKSG